MNKMIVVYAQEALPQSWTKSIFLAGPTPRGEDIPSWRVEALDILYKMGYDGVVFVPEARNGVSFDNLDYTKQVEWEDRCLGAADRIFFWIARNMQGMPGLTTNDEWGVWKNSKKVILGLPPGAEKVRYQKYYADKYKIPTYTNMYVALAETVGQLGTGCLRLGGEKFVPKDIYEHTSFEEWRKAQISVGNRIDDARVLWTFGGHGAPFCYAIWLKVWIASENRHKSNEFMIGRTPVSACVAYYDDGSGDPDVLLVKEFRTPVANSLCMVVELPGGSSKKGSDPALTIVEELEEEVGLIADPDRLVYMGVRQLASTMLAHKCSLYSYRMNETEFNSIKSIEGQVRGVIEDSEMCYPIMVKLSSVLSDQNLDFSTVGMILAGII